MVELTVLHGIMRGWYGKTALTVKMFDKARTEYHGDRRVDGDETKYFLLTVSAVLWKLT